MKLGARHPLPPTAGGMKTNRWCILPRDVWTLTYCQRMAFSIEPLKIKLLAGEQISQPRNVDCIVVNQTVYLWGGGGCSPPEVG